MVLTSFSVAVSSTPVMGSLLVTTVQRMLSCAIPDNYSA